MEARLNVYEQGLNAIKMLHGIGAYLRESTIGAGLRELICIRVSQINNCAFCIDIHYREARANGETDQRLFDLSSWREGSLYNAREKAAIALAEAITNCKVPDIVYFNAKKHFSDEELIDLTLTVTTINTWNRINNVFVSKRGIYQVCQFEL